MNPRLVSKQVTVGDVFGLPTEHITHLGLQAQRADPDKEAKKAAPLNHFHSHDFGHLFLVHLESSIKQASSTCQAENEYYTDIP